MNREAFIRSGRSVKVAKMVAAIDEAQAELDPQRDPLADAQAIYDELRALPTALPRSKWHVIQLSTGNRRKDPPSLETIADVLDVYARRVTAAARFDEPESDTFAVCVDELEDDARYFGDEEAV